MRKLILYLVLGLAVLGACIAVALLVALRKPALAIDEILAGYREDAEYGELTIRYPLDETLFPPEIVPPTFRWKDSGSGSDAWVVTIRFQDDPGRMSFPCFQTEWTPPDEPWEAIKRRILAKTLLESGQVYRKHGETAKAEQRWRKAAVLEAENT